LIRSYYYLAKPGIIYGNVITTVAGFLLASQNGFDTWLFVASIIGISFVMGSACVFNNIADRDIDIYMERTQNRALVTKKIPVRNALAYGIILGLIGFKVLFFFTTPIATMVAAVGFVVYVGLYTPLKKKTVHATLVGSISGAVPPVVGYTAVTGKLDTGAWILFAILTLWQMPHFYSIAIFRLNDYKKAMIPVLPAKKSIYATKIYIIVYIILYIIAAGLLTVAGYTGYIYLGVMAVTGLAWLWFALGGFRKGIVNEVWARKLFRFSLIVLLIFSLTVSISGIINT
jgi:protoheme IX farnesyltransferase